MSTNPLSRNMKPDKELVHLFAELIREWRRPRGDTDKSLDKCYTKDRKQLRHVLSLFRRGKYLEAGLEAQSMDTILRDIIPDKAWRLMCEARTDER